MAISTLAYKITADAHQFKSEIAASRRELNLAKRVMTETEEPSAKLQKSLTALEGIFHKGLIGPQEYAKAQKKVKDEILGTSTEVTGLQGKLGPLGKAFDAVGLSIVNKFVNPLTAAMAAAGAFSLLSRKVGQSMQDIDKLAERAKSTGIDINELRAFEFAGERTGIEPEGISRSLQEMQKFTAKAGMGGGAEQKMMATLGLDQSAMGGKDIAGQFSSFADAINRMGTQGERLEASQQVFGRQGREFIRLLELGSTGLAETRAQVRAFLGDIDATKIDKLLDDAAAAKLAKEGFFGGIGERRAEQFGGPANFLAEQGVPVSGRTLGRFLGAGGGPQNIAQSIVDLVKDIKASMKSADTQTSELRKIEANTRKPPIEVTERGL